MTLKFLLYSCLFFFAAMPVWSGEGQAAEEKKKAEKEENFTKNTELSPEAKRQLRKHQYQLILLKQEKERLELENELFSEKQKRELAELTANRDKLLLENELKEAMQKRKVADLLAEKERLELAKEKLELQNAIREAEQKQKMLDSSMEKSRLELANQLQEEKNKREELNLNLENARLSFKSAELEFERNRKRRYLDELDEKIANRAKQEEWESQSNKPPQYLLEPVVDGRLVISDRRILLNEPILPGLADYITERISFFNSKNDKYPIFLVIDRCMGGSVLEGAQILKAMHSSTAPVYVVVRTMAASMAATITALAERSFAYPNAIVVHHQILVGFYGNMTQQKERLQMSNDWAERLMTPVAEKMGVSLDEFIKQMYEHNSDGNWVEFADQARKFNWVTEIVTEVEETAYVKKPEESQEPLANTLSLSMNLKESRDENGHPYMQLPYLGPGDFYYMYNPDNYYR